MSFCYLLWSAVYFEMWHMNAFDVDVGTDNEWNKTCRLLNNHHLSGQMIVGLFNTTNVQEPERLIWIPADPQMSTHDKTDGKHRQPAVTVTTLIFYSAPQMSFFSHWLRFVSLSLPGNNSSTCGLLVNGSIRQ